MALTDIEPITRNEAFLEDIAEGNAEATLDPITREEEFLRRIASFNATEKAAVQNIYDKIPVDPESTDVGKVMTVVEDTSGEEPVYKWSAEASGGLSLVKERHSDFTLTSNSYSTNIKWTIADIGSDIVSALKTLFSAASGTGEKVTQFFRDHVRLYANGEQAYCNAAAPGSDGTILVNSYITVPATISGNPEAAQLTIRFKVHMSAEETTDFITDGSTQAYKASEQIFGTSNITGVTRVYLKMEIWM